MCELFAVCSRGPVGLCCSLDEFDRHGGGTAPHGDGWGLASYIDRDALLVKEARPAFGSELARWVREHPLHSSLVIGHVRKATMGAHAFMNTQPFVRERAGATHVFAHNGHLDLEALRRRAPPNGPRPVGDTDSERAFCQLLGELVGVRQSALPGVDDRIAGVAAFAARMRALGPANFLYADGELLFAHGHRRTHGAEGIRPPGLWMLELDEGVGGACPGLIGMGRGASGQPAVLFASVPLSDDPRWRPMREGEVAVVRGGEVVGAVG